MKTPKELCDALAASLGTISGLRVYASVPPKMNEFPAAMIVPEEGDYEVTWSDKIRHTLRVQVFVQLGDLISAQEAIAPFFYEVRDAIDADHTLGGEADAAHVTRYEDYGLRAAPGSAEPNTLGVDFLVEVMA